MIRFIQDNGTILDGIGITLCVLIIGYLICNRVKYGRMVRQVEKRQDFGNQVIGSMVSQQIRDLLISVMEKVESELHPLEGPTLETTRGVRPVSGQAVLSAGDRSRQARADTQNEAVSAVSRLVAAGMGLSDISRSVRRPLAEVELCAWLGRHRFDRPNQAVVGSRRQ